MTKILKSTDLECFQQQGYVCLPEAFSPVDALAMQDFIWDKLEEKCSILRSEPTTWNKHVTGLNKSAGNAVYRNIASQRMCDVIDDLLGEDTWETPKKWGNFLISFPQKLDQNWSIPTSQCNGIPDGRVGPFQFRCNLDVFKPVHQVLVIEGHRTVAVRKGAEGDQADQIALATRTFLVFGQDEVGNNVLDRIEAVDLLMIPAEVQGRHAV